MSMAAVGVGVVFFPANWNLGKAANWLKKAAMVTAWEEGGERRAHFQILEQFKLSQLYPDCNVMTSFQV